MTVAVDCFFAEYDNSGNPLSGGKVFTYSAGTTTPLNSYTDQTGATPNTNPVILDSAGRASIWLTANVAYKLVLTDSLGVVIKTTDNYYAGASPEQLVAAGIVPATGGTYTGLVSFTGGAIFDGTSAQDLATLNSLGVASAQITNLWINADFSLSQRGVGTFADATYGFDRTINLCDTGSTTLSQLQQPLDGIPFAMRITQPDASPKRIGFCQIVESRNCFAYRGQQLIFAPKIRTSVASTVRVALVAWTGAIDSPPKDVVNNWNSTTYTAGNFFIANTTVIAITASATAANVWADLSASSASPGGIVAPSAMNNLYIVVWTDSAIAQNFTLDASLARCAIGTNIPAWQPVDVTVEYLKCIRYFYRQLNPQLKGVSTAANTFRVGMNHPAPMRVNPIATQTGTFSVFDGGGTTTSTGLGSVFATQFGFDGNGVTSTSVLTIGRCCIFYVDPVATGTISLDAEIGT